MPVRSVLSEQLPDLGQLPYKVRYLLETDSKMSHIYLVTDEAGRYLVLKVARVDQRVRAEANRQAIQNEAEWLKQFRGVPGIIQILPVDSRGTSRRLYPHFVDILDKVPGEPEFLALDYLGGGALSNFVGRNRLDVAVAVRITHYLARSLEHLHSAGCVHRDVKPENVLFSVLPKDQTEIDQFVPTLIDFGVAAQVGEKRLVSGSRLWMAPELQEAYEQAPVHVDPSWDVFALGLILCYMITGLRPRRRSYDYAGYVAYSQRAFTLLDQELVGLQNGVQPFDSAAISIQRVKILIQRTLAKEPKQRLTAAEIVGETAQILAGLGAPLPVKKKITRTAALGRLIRQQWIWAAAALLTIAVLATGYWFGGGTVRESGGDPSVETNELLLTRTSSSPAKATGPEPLPSGGESLPSDPDATNSVAPTLIPLAPTLVPLPSTAAVNAVPKATPFNGASQPTSHVER